MSITNLQPAWQARLSLPLTYYKEINKVLQIEKSPDVVTGLLTHPNFRDGIMPHIYNFRNVELLLKCSFIAKEKGFTLKQQPKSKYREHFIFSHKHWKEVLRSPAMKRLKKGE